MDTSTKATMMNMEEVRHEPVDQHCRSVMGVKLKSALILLFVVTLLLECANLTLTTKCETHLDASSALKTLISTTADQSFSLSDLMLKLEQREESLNTTTLSTSVRVVRSLCTLQREFLLEMSDKRINVCTYQGRVRVDLRQFLNGRATIKGIFFNTKELLSLRKLMPLIKGEVDRQLTHHPDSITPQPVSTLCTLRKDFFLEMSDKRVNVCTYQHRVRVDVRQFLNGFGTRKGIFLSTRKLLSLRKLLPLIQDEVDRQTTYDAI